MKADIVLTGEGEIDNAYIFINDPGEQNKIWFEPKSSVKFEISNIEVGTEDSLQYQIKVKAYYGTKFKCIITREDEKAIEIEGITGSSNNVILTDSKDFKDE